MKILIACCAILTATLSTPLWADNYNVIAYASMNDILATPGNFHGKKVMVTGWVISINDEYVLCRTKVPDSPIDCIWMDVESKDSTALGNNNTTQQRKKLMAQYKGRLLSVSATFNTNNTGTLDQISGGLLAIAHLRSH